MAEPSLNGMLQLFWREGMPWILAITALLALILARAPGPARVALRHTLVFFAFCLALEAAGAVLEALAVEAGAPLRGVGVMATGLAVIRLAGLALFRVLLPAGGLTAPRIVEDIALVAAYIAWGLLRLRLAGMDLASLVTTSAVMTAVLAFAMQDTLGNVLGGLFVELDRSIAIGDWMRLDDVSGRVEQIRWRHTAIRTRNGERVIVPNSVLMKSRFAVIGNPDEEDVRWRRWVWFDVGMDVAPAKVLAAADQALAGAQVPNVLHEPHPSCALMEFRDGECRYALRYWLRDPLPDDGTDSVVRVHLLAALRRAGITPAMPEYVIHEVREGAARDAERAVKETQRRMAALGSVELFGSLGEDELKSLADHLVHAPFAAGDVMTHQGAVAHWLYLLVEGEAEVWVEAAANTRRQVATLAAGSVFGEMGMMTGEPRAATVVARTDVECYRLDKAGFAGILRARPALAEEMSRVLAARSRGLQQVVQEARAGNNVARHQENVLARIRAFFGLEAASTV